MQCCGFIGGRDAEQQRLIERTPDEIHTHGKPRSNGAHQTRPVPFGDAIPDFGRETRRYSDHGKTLLAEHRPADRWPSVRGWFTRRREFAWRNSRHWSQQRIELLFLHALQQQRLKSETSLKPR